MKRLTIIFLGALLLLLRLSVVAQNEQQHVTNDSLLHEIGEMRHEIDELRHEIKGLKGKVDRTPKLSGFAQCQFDFEADKNGFSVNTFRIRRARLVLSGSFNRIVSYKLQGEFGNSPSLVDAYVKFKFLPEIAVQIGQFKTPFTLESQISALDLEMIDYSDEIFALAGYRDVSTNSENGIGEKLKIGRDIGLMLSGGLIHVERNNDKFNIIEYNIGIFNGNGINCLDKGLRKDIVGRIDIHPMLRDLTLSGSLYYGSLYGNDTTNLDRKRWSAGIQYNDGHYVFRGEYISGNNGRVTESSDTTFLTENFRSNGYYAVFGYWFKFKKENQPDEQRLMPTIRFDHFTKDMGDKRSPTNKYTIGLSYWPFKNINLKLNYSLVQKKEFDEGNNLANVFTHNVAAIVNLKY